MLHYPIHVINPRFLILLACAQRLKGLQENEDAQDLREDDGEDTGGGAGGALGAVVMHQNIFEGAIIGALTGAAFTAATYGMARAIKSAKTNKPAEIYGARDQNKEAQNIKYEHLTIEELQKLEPHIHWAREQVASFQDEFSKMASFTQANDAQIMYKIDPAKGLTDPQVGFDKPVAGRGKTMTYVTKGDYVLAHSPNHVIATTDLSYGVRVIVMESHYGDVRVIVPGFGKTVTIGSFSQFNIRTNIWNPYPWTFIKEHMVKR